MRKSILIRASKVYYTQNMYEKEEYRVKRQNTYEGEVTLASLEPPGTRIVKV